VVRLGDAITQTQAGYSSNIDQARVRSKNAFRHHYQDVQEMVPQERLLVFKLRDGWKPLCEFLGKPLPEVDFPHENETARNTQGFVEIAQMGLKHAAMNAALAISLIGIPLSAAYYYRLWR
jgi:hypothetical protein